MWWRLAVLGKNPPFLSGGIGEIPE